MKTEAQAKACTLLEFIAEKFGGNQSEFARAQGVSRQQVNEWLVKDFIVFDGQLYSPRRKLKT
jgi:DNA-binding transcriptional regulator YiaG